MRFPSTGIPSMCAGRVPHAIRIFSPRTCCTPSSFTISIVCGSAKCASLPAPLHNSAAVRLDHVHFPRHHRLRRSTGPTSQSGLSPRSPVRRTTVAAIRSDKARLPASPYSDRSGMKRKPAHRQPTVDNRDFLAHFRRANRALLSRRTAPDHYQVVFVCLHNVRTAKDEPSTLLTSRERYLCIQVELRVL